jgi:2,3-bisphosphoglycerate-independent phosphoglycerate mutase
MARQFKPVVLISIDGWGKSATWKGNVFEVNKQMFMNSIFDRCPNAFLKISDKQKVEIVEEKINYATLGSGRWIRTNSEDIDGLIENGSFFSNDKMRKLCVEVIKNNSTLHLIGYLTPGGYYGSLTHLMATIKFAKLAGLKKVALHLISQSIYFDGKEALNNVKKLERFCKKEGVGEICSIVGQDYLLNKEKVGLVYRSQIIKQGALADDAEKAFLLAYEKGYSDNNFPPTLVQNTLPEMSNEDIVFFVSCKEEGTKELLDLYESEKKDKRLFGKLANIAKPEVFTLLEQGNQRFIYKEDKINNTLAEKLASSGLKCAYICDGRSSKLINYFRGSQEEYFEGEERFIIRHENKKEKDILDKIIDKTKDLIEDQKFDFIFVSIGVLANCAMESDFLQAAKISARISAGLEEVHQSLSDNGVLILTSAFGGAEAMIREKPVLSEFRKTDNPVPMIIISSENDLDLFNRAWNKIHKSDLKRIVQTKNGLIDVAPTVMDIFNIPKPKVMEGIGLKERLKIR